MFGIFFTQVRWSDSEYLQQPELFAALNHYEPINTDVRQRKDDEWLLLYVVCKKQEPKKAEIWLWLSLGISFKHIFY